MKVGSRFSNFRDKLQVFFLGLLFGLVLGGGFFVLKLDQYVKELSFYKSLTEPKHDQNDLMPVDTKTEEEKPVAKKTKKENHPITPVDSIKVVGVLDADSSSQVVVSGNKNTSEIVVRTDEQMAAKTYTIINLDNEKKDSLNPKETSAGNLAVEFWKSPLNYHGYKLSRNKLVLFGYGDQDLVSVFKMDNTTFLKCLTGVFKVEPSTDFHQMERVTDESLLARIK
ncbi:MAG TPA: hypothetical protein VFJ43_16080 [Bacteroidia bacterium]|nr:hypothetical protein [Bacteroidia bacterium]